MSGLFLSCNLPQPPNNRYHVEYEMCAQSGTRHRHAGLISSCKLITTLSERGGSPNSLMRKRRLRRRK